MRIYWRVKLGSMQSFENRDDDEDEVVVVKMVNTFVTSSSVVQCAKDLDPRRLGKQRVEAYQIWRVIKGLTKGWKNHPAARAWEGHECALAMYTNVMIREWISRGYKNTMEFLPHCKNPRFPWWWGWEPVIMSHRASLNRKMPEYYKFSDLGVYADYGYIWPTKVPVHLRVVNNFENEEEIKVVALRVTIE